MIGAWPPRVGDLAPWRNLGAMLRSKWDDDRAAVLSEIRERTAIGVPLDDSEPEDSDPIKDPGAYPHDPKLDDISVRLMNADPDDVARMKVSALRVELALVSQPDNSDGTLDLIEELRAVARRFLTQSVQALAVKGVGEFGGDDGLSDDDLNWAGRAGILFQLFNVARRFHALTVEERGNYGAPVLSISVGPNSTAADALPSGAPCSDAGEAPVASGSKATNTNPTPAPGGSLSATRGSGDVSSNGVTAAVTSAQT